MAGEIVVIDGTRYRVEDAEALGILGERPVPGESRALSLTAAQVDVDAIVEARVAKHEAELNDQFEQRLDDAVTARIDEEFEKRVAAAVAEQAATQTGAAEAAVGDDEAAADAKPAAPATPVKPANKSARPANK